MLIVAVLVVLSWAAVGWVAWNRGWDIGWQAAWNHVDDPELNGEEE